MSRPGDPPGAATSATAATVQVRGPRRLDVPELKLHPSIVVEIALTMDEPRFYPLRMLHAHDTWHPIRASPAYLQVPLGDEAGEYLPQCSSTDTKFVNQGAFRRELAPWSVLAR